ncbi:hypothetical protein HHK36_002552 [Tetracentron sinense]|uniref:Alpha/beta hydrolase fold-3 domain-containing protein n=1 Tax=Tetracentron sinense TaxID=13715 RepID=A0A834ZWN1_TETSI|nr:hypothetical protein HHK36_002552 [Tetracentron sinense]
MDSSTKPEVAYEVPPYLRVFKDGHVERLIGTDIVPPSLDIQTGVSSKDIIIIPESGLSARFYLPKLTHTHQKLPLIIYFHGGAFCISSASDPHYHRSLNSLAFHANAIAVSVNYRRVPEHPLPIAYEDSWEVLQWVASQYSKLGDGAEAWLNSHADFERVFLAGDSAGANIAHHLAMRAADKELAGGVRLLGAILVHPYFWGEEAIGVEVLDPARKAMVDKWWLYVCSSLKGNDDPLINPVAVGAPSLAGLGCKRVLVCVAEKDILRDRGRVYYEALVKSGWPGGAEIVETEGEDHVFHLFNPTCEKAVVIMKRLASFINQDKALLLLG